MTKPQFESYRYVGEVGRLQSQSMVECRFAGSEISSILAAQVHVAPGDCICKDGEVQYAGKAMISIVYEDGDRKICRVERGVEFFHKAEGKEVTPACFVKPSFTADNVNFRREGSGLYLSAVIQADLLVYGSKQMEYLSGGDLIGKEGKITAYKNVCVSGEAEGEDEFDTEYVGDILLHSEKALVTKVSGNAGTLDIEGEIALNICVLKQDDSVCSYERIVPFKMQIPCEETFGRFLAGGRAQIKSAYLSANADEESGKSKMVFSYSVLCDCFLSSEEEITLLSDAFSTTEELFLKKKKEGGRYLTNTAKYSERISGSASLSPVCEGEYSLQSAVLPRAELFLKKTEQGWEAEGIAQAEIILKGADGVKKSTLSLPFVFPLDIQADEAEGECIVCSLNVRRRKDGVTEAEGVLKCSLRCYAYREWEYVGEVVEGEKRTEEDCAFSVIMTGAGEELWDVAKRLRCSPESLQKNNPELVFPLKEGAKIFIYRQSK